LKEVRVLSLFGVRGNQGGRLIMEGRVKGKYDVLKCFVSIVVAGQDNANKATVTREHVLLGEKTMNWL
jgi:hypothetical protein